VRAATQPSATTEPPRRRKGEETAERILDAAEALFAERGYAGTTLRHVAAEVGLRTPSLYNHFPSKESLYAEVLERGIRPVFEVLSEVVLARNRSDREVRQVVERAMALVARRPNIPRLIQHEILEGGRRFTPMLRGWIQRVFARAYEMVETSASTTRWEPDQLPLLVLAMYHIFVGYFTIAPLYKDLNGEDLLAQQALEKQTRFFADLSAALFAEETPERSPK
jgi:TetR/AcrR family transcriptional regulator